MQKNMGVFGLTTYCNENADIASQAVDLKAEAPLTLLVDGPGVLSCLSDQAEANFSPLARCLGGSYELYETAVEAFVTRMQAEGITLRFFFDPSRGTDGNSAKTAEWAARFKQGMQRADRIEAYCKGKAEASSIDWDQPPLAHRAMLSTLKRLGVQLEVPDSLTDPTQPTQSMSTQSSVSPVAGSRLRSLRRLGVPGRGRCLPSDHLCGHGGLRCAG